MKSAYWKPIVAISLISWSAISSAKIYPGIVELHAPLFDDLGAFHHPITTSEPMAQRFFDQGLVLFYGFEWGESIRSFREATRLDPNCGMCYWGLAMALGSKINAPMSGDEYQIAKSAIQKALSLKAYESLGEQAYIQSLSKRFSHRPKKLTSPIHLSCHLPSASLDAASKKEQREYVAAMKQLIKSNPDDLDAKALYVYAIFELIDWKFWAAHGKIHPMTPILMDTLKEVLVKDRSHIGANHYYVHVMEQSPKPHEALDSANRLRTLVPGSEHLVHMPSHIYLHTGQYHEGSASNVQAISAFKKYNKTCIAQGYQPEINYNYFHNYEFLRYTATLEGRSQLALTTSRKMLKQPYPSWLKNELSLQWFMPIPYFVESRFAMWREIMKEKKPLEKYQYALGMWHYARGVALAQEMKINQALQEEANLKKIIITGPNDKTLQKNGITLLKIADATLNAVLMDKQGKDSAAITFLKAADKLQSDMGYHEPPDWYFPAKEALADAYLKSDHPLQAKETYEQVLRIYPHNGWALYGLAKSLKILGKDQEAIRVERSYKEAWRYADIPAPKSLFRLKDKIQ